MAVLQDQGLSRAQLGLLKVVLQHMGSEKRVGDLYSNRTFSSRFVTMAKQNLRVSASHLGPIKVHLKEHFTGDV